MLQVGWAQALAWRPPMIKLKSEVKSLSTIFDRDLGLEVAIA